MKRIPGWLMALSLMLPLSGFSQIPNKITLPSQGDKVLLHQGWLARQANEINYDGNLLTMKPFDQQGWIPARVPGTVLTTLMKNGKFQDPEFGLNNVLIPDIERVGSDFYTYWFLQRFELDNVITGNHIWLNFRGINYKSEIYLNGHRFNKQTLEGMFMRHSFDITEYIKKDSINTLAVLVLPPDHVGSTNGGQGGDGQIARNCTMQYTPGWDWIQPVKDRNTGIWDEVSVTTTGDVLIDHPYLVTKVPGIRQPNAAKQAPAYLETSVEVKNITADKKTGTLVLSYDGKTIKQPVTLNPREHKTVSFKSQKLDNPKLWWPNGIGEQPLNEAKISFVTADGVSDEETIQYGIRELSTAKNAHNGGREFYVNGQRIWITGGNYINSDWLLRLSPERYDHEVRFHAEMNVRMIRVWGGALLERPDFYKACDKYGILVFQDLWGSGDCNGAWEDPYKKDSRERRWEYPDNHPLFLAMAEDQIKMIRNHPSLCMWCGANEWPLAKDIDAALKNEIFPKLDPNRLFVSYSTDTLFTRNLLGDNGDGPYGIQEPDSFYMRRSHPFNPEMGSVGSPEVESFRKFMSQKDLDEFPRNGRTKNHTWQYHRDLGYGNHLERYGAVNSIEEYCQHAQVVNYNQYRTFMEGWASHMWDWYTGILIWKTQNPWTALRGQMYDWYLDVNASLYGTRKGCEPLHPSYNIISKKVELQNTSLASEKDLTVKAELFNRDGKCFWWEEMQSDSEASSVKELMTVPAAKEIQGAYFLKLTLADANGKKLTDNIYWLTTTPKDYSTLHQLPTCKPTIKVEMNQDGKTYTGKVSLKADKAISFFNRIKVFDKQTGELVLPVHYSDNYITLMPGDERNINLDFVSELPKNRIEIVVESWTSEPIRTSNF